MSNKAISVYAEALKRQQQETQSQNTPEVTRKVTQPRDMSRESSRGVPREKPRGNDRDMTRDNPHNHARVQPREHITHTSRTNARPISRVHTRDLPTRDEIQAFSFRLRDEFRVKVQAEVPPDWQKELDDIARDLNVKKLELYRYILGDFLGKVNRKPSS